MSQTIETKRLLRRLWLLVVVIGAFNINCGLMRWRECRAHGFSVTYCLGR